ncbi:Panacea domain-containing protein [Corynebacterium vitaeruminis]|uniref:Antitoxin SocA-like Panacea domain-containing protein n=1 Tax=Corynebacterium vitaeruminis DSM 20294 TaxID=1224164 RepID=W5Y3Y4_9CORY|nr:Panacea domain-containing protein [Corynebacterium vitaeruminis]AHI23922.1 hypothetical protein B843_12730 [Corynebacterium vitaeruminis DSM 20294]
MANILDVGQYIVELRGGRVDRHKLAKLCFFAQGWHLAWTGKPLTDSRFQAWKFGPVPTELGRFSMVAEGSNDVTGIVNGDSSRLSDYEHAVIASIVDFYGDMDFATLTKLSHGLSWEEARQGIPENAPSSENLSVTTMLEEFSHLVHDGGELPQAPTLNEDLDLEAALAASELVEADWKATFHLLATR